MTKGWATAALAVVAALLVGAGLWLGGGPDQARKERRDRQRLDDLTVLQALVGCLARANHDQLPERLTPSPQCNWPAELKDPFTGQPYRYAVTGPNSYRLCADFETPAPAEGRSGPFTRDKDGCIGRLHVPPPQATEPSPGPAPMPQPG